MRILAAQQPTHRFRQDTHVALFPVGEMVSRWVPRSTRAPATIHRMVRTTEVRRRSTLKPTDDHEYPSRYPGLVEDPRTDG